MAAKKGGLGRGLDLLFQDTGASSADDGVTMLRLTEVEPDKAQPRKHFDDAALGELADSISQHGVLQPIVVRQVPGGSYKIVAGERRWRAARLAGLDQIPVLVKDISEQQAMELALIENLQREDLDPVEEAAGYRQLMDRCGYTQETAAQKLGKSRSAVANSLRLLNLPPKALEDLKKGLLTPGHAKAVLGLPDEESRQQAADWIVERGLSVREAELLCRNMMKQPKKRKPTLLPPLPREVELSLKEVLGTEVKVRYKGGKGELQVHFYSDDQLKEFANLLGKYTKEK